MLTLAWLYYRFRGLQLVQGVLGGLRPAVVALIASAGLSLALLAVFGQRSLPSAQATFHPGAALIFAGTFFALRKWKPKPLWVMAAAAAAGVALGAVGMP